MRKTLMAILTAVCLNGSTSGVATAQTIAESARARPGQPVVRGAHPDLEPVSPERLAVEADLIVEADLVRTRTYLTPDEQYVFTDYRIIPTRVIAGQMSNTATKPGQPPDLTLTVKGGNLVVNGIEVQGIDYTLELPKDHGRYLLFLRRFGTGGIYELVHGAIFEESGTGLRHLLKNKPNAYRDVTDAPRGALIERVQAARRNKQ